MDSRRGVLIGRPDPRARRRSRPTPDAVVEAAAGVVAELGPDEGPVGIGLPAAARRRRRDDGGQHRPVLDRRRRRRSSSRRRSAAPCVVLNDADAAGLAEIRFGAGQGRQGRRADAHPGHRHRVGPVPRRGARAEHGARPHRDPGQGRRAARLGRSAGAPRPVDQGVGAAAGRVPRPRGPARLAGPDHPGRRHLQARRQVPRGCSTCARRWWPPRCATRRASWAPRSGRGRCWRGRARSGRRRPAPAGERGRRPPAGGDARAGGPVRRQAGA